MFLRMDENTFFMHLHNGRTIGQKYQNCFKYADIACGYEHIKMTVRISGGLNGRTEAPFIAFKTSFRSYPIKGVPDTFPVVWYRMVSRVQMDKAVFEPYLSEPLVTAPLLNGKI